MKTCRMKFSCLKKYKLFIKKTVNFRIIIIIFFIEAVLTITRNLCFRAETTWFLRVPHTYFRAETRKRKRKQKKKKKKKKQKKKKRFIVLQSPLFLCEVVFVTGVFIMKAGYLDVLS